MKMIYEWMGDIAGFFVFLTAVLHFIPEENYGKYIRYFMGLLFMLLLLMPALQVFDLKEKVDTSFSEYMQDAVQSETDWVQYGKEKEAEYMQKYQELLQEIEQEVQRENGS